jgi:uncharacterized protein (PEP-CTERM system associated)
MNHAAGGAAFGCTLIVASAAAMADQWRIMPRASVEESYTSNVRLAPKGQEESDLITRLTPGVSIRGTGPSLRVGVDYDPDLLFYLDADDQNGIRNNLAGFASADWFERRLLLDTQASIVQAFANPTAGVAGANSLALDTIPTRTSDVTGSNNLTEVQSFNFSPAWRDRFGDFAEGELRYRFGAVFSGDSSISDLTTNTLSASLHSVQAGGGRLGWGLSALQDWTDTSGGTSGIGGTGGTALGDTSRQRSLVRSDLSYRVFSQLSLLGSLGWETVKDPTLFDPPDGPTWNIGFEYRIRPRSFIRVTYGRRFEDQDLEVASQWQLGSTTKLSLGYTQSLQTSQSSLLGQTTQIGVDRLGNLIDVVTGLPFQPGERTLGLTSQTFHETSLRATLTSTRGRNIYSALANYDKRESELPLTDKETVAGAGVSWERRLRPDLTFDAQFDYRNLEFEGGLSGTDNVYSLSSGLALNLSHDTTLQLRLRQTERDSSEEIRSLSETLVSLRLSKTF